jgi:hypothetical protein
MLLRLLPVALVMLVSLILLAVDVHRLGWSRLLPPTVFWGGFGIWGVVSALAGAGKLDPPWSWLVQITHQLFLRAAAAPGLAAVAVAATGILVVLVLAAVGVIGWH